MSSTPHEHSLEYREMNLHQHCLHRPDMYVSSRYPCVSDETIALYDEHDQLYMTSRSITHIPALLRIFIEALSNAIDNRWRSDEHGIPFRSIRVSIQRDTGCITIWNDGLAIPIRMNDAGDTWIPQMLFGRLLTSSNYNDEEERYTSGRNGLGISLTNIFSSSFKIDLVDPVTQQQYTQEWSDHMTHVSNPIIRRRKKRTGYTQVSWIADFQYFNLPHGYTDDMVALMRKYVCDAAMITEANVYFDNIKLPIHSLKDYTRLFQHTHEMIHIRTSQSEMILVSSNGTFETYSFVNGVHTSDGGVHVDSWMDTIFKPLTQSINRKYKDVKLTIKDIKPYFKLFVKCQVPNPEFSSQTKTHMISPKINTAIEPRHLQQLLKWSFMKHIEDHVRSKELITLKRSERKSRNTQRIEGFDPANKAGTKESHRCTLILCEGLSAKTYAVLGIQKGIDFGEGCLHGRSYFGILALRGKGLNTRNASISSISENKELTHIIQALGLQYGVDYQDPSNFKTLRYGRVLLLCDSDVDGFHIQALLMNMFDHLFPSLLKRQGFLLTMHTPIVKIDTKHESLRFYHLDEAKRYLEHHQGNATVRYYKGLGTSTDKDVRETFGQRIVEYVYDTQAPHTLFKVFHKDNASLRKQWLKEYDEDAAISVYHSLYEPTDQPSILRMSISNFMNYDMIRFSIDDCKRSLPHIIDGLKESQRKCLFAAFIKGSNKNIKTAQLSGFVAERTHYHHGEQCLHDTITKMAQDFIGSNNIPLFDKEGQFGSLISLGKDAANARYTFTKISATASLIFHSHDNPILHHIIDEGQSIEPHFYAPIIPMILVNGVNGSIGTGWSSSVPCFNPHDIIHWLQTYLYGKSTDAIQLIPWYRGFQGQIAQINKHRYETRGVLESTGTNKFRVTALPIGISIDKYKEFLEDLVDQRKIKQMRNESTPTHVHFDFKRIPDGIEPTLDTLHLKTTLSTSNMVAFTERGHIRKFETLDDIMHHFVSVRLDFYQKRKQQSLDTLNHQYTVLKNKMRFLRHVMDQTLNLQEHDEAHVIRQLKSHHYTPIDGHYEYLLSLPIRAFTPHHMHTLTQKARQLKTSIRELTQQTEEQLWLNDLERLQDHLSSFIN